MTETERKILNMLIVIHEENKLIITGLMRFTNRPQNFEENKNDLLKKMDKIVNDALEEEIYE